MPCFQEKRVLHLSFQCGDEDQTPSPLSRFPYSSSYLGPTLPLAHPSFPSTHLFQVGKCHGAGSLCCAGGKYGVQFPLSISFVSPSCPEQLWQCLCCRVRFLLCTNRSLPCCLWAGTVCPELILLLCLTRIRQSSHSLGVSGAVTGSHSGFCPCTTPCPQGGQAGREGLFPAGL